MPPNDAFEAVNARLLLGFPELVEQLGGNPGEICEASGISVDSLGRNDASISYRDVAGLLELAARRLGCDDFGMRLAARQRGLALGPLSEVMQNSRTFGDALNYVSQHESAHSSAAHIWFQDMPDKSQLLVAHDILLAGVPLRSQLMEQILLLGHYNAMDITAGKVRSRSVLFRHEAISAPRTYRKYFFCTVRFGQQFDGLVIARKALACPIEGVDEVAFARAVDFIEQNYSNANRPWHARVRGCILGLLGLEPCSVDRVAAALSIHPRSLHRKLCAEGASYQRVLDDVRRDLLLYLVLQTDLDLTVIAHRLGFSEHSVLTRCCVRWFDAPPSELRLRKRVK